MRRDVELNIVPTVILIWCAWKSRELLTSWLQTPYECFAWLAFLIWTATPLLSRLLCKPHGKPAELDFNQGFKDVLLLTTVLIMTAGQLADLRFCFHVGLACAMAGILLTRFDLRATIWLLSAVCWMPVFGWGFQANSSTSVVLLRLSVAMISMSCFRYGTTSAVLRSAS